MSMHYKARRIGRACKRFWRRVNESLANVLIITSIVVVILLVISTLGLVTTQITLQTDQQPPALWANATDFTFKILGIDPSDNRNAHLEAISIVLNAGIYLISLFLAILPVVTYMRYRTKIKNERSIRTWKVKRGEGDIEEMLKAYRGASNVTVFSGDFSWLSRSNPSKERLLEEICNLAEVNKIDLISHKSESTVQQKVGNGIYNELCDSFLFAEDLNLKCSLVEYDEYNSKFLYLNPGVQGDPNFVIVRSSDRSRRLMGALKKMINKIKADAVPPSHSC